LLLSLAVCACGPGRTGADAQAGPEHAHPLRLDGHTVRAQVALSFPEQRQGLMGRPQLDADAGMLFPYRQPQAMSFWMANTLIHLDVGFFTSDGVLREVHTMVAGDTTATRSRRSDLRFALEMNAGWFARHNVRPGARLDLADLAAALRQRGADPATYGL
jgi:hypothetical protein